MIRHDIVDAFRLQVRWCRELGSPFTADLLELAAGSLEARGALASLLQAWPGSPVADALSLRFAGALHRRVLREPASALAAAYPRPDRKGDALTAWRAGEAVIAGDPPGFLAELSSPPQTNETRRSLGLLPGLLVLAERFGREMDFYELGASAGLNLLMDRFSYRTPAWAWGGASTVTVEGEWRGGAPPVSEAPQVAGRAGCDRNPLDPCDETDRLRLRSFVWADQFDRLARLEAALAMACEAGVRVDRADAGDWIAARLPARTEGRLAVVYHSVFWQYPEEATRTKVAAAMAAAAAAATEETPLAWLRLEPASGAEGSRPGGHTLDLVTWPGGERRLFGEIDPHGRWVEWRS